MFLKQLLRATVVGSLLSLLVWIGARGVWWSHARTIDASVRRLNLTDAFESRQIAKQLAHLDANGLRSLVRMASHPRVEVALAAQDEIESWFRIRPLLEPQQRNRRRQVRRLLIAELSLCQPEFGVTGREWCRQLAARAAKGAPDLFGSPRGKPLADCDLILSHPSVNHLAGATIGLQDINSMRDEWLAINTESGVSQLLATVDSGPAGGSLAVSPSHPLQVLPTEYLAGVSRSNLQGNGPVPLGTDDTESATPQAQPIALSQSRPAQHTLEPEDQGHAQPEATRNNSRQHLLRSFGKDLATFLEQASTLEILQYLREVQPGNRQRFEEVLIDRGFSETEIEISRATTHAQESRRKEAAEQVGQVPRVARIEWLKFMSSDSSASVRYAALSKLSTTEAADVAQFVHDRALQDEDERIAELAHQVAPLINGATGPGGHRRR